MLKHFDAFAGYGGFSIACERCGIETIGISEVNPFANQVLRYNFPEVKNYGDITKIKTQELPDFDLLTGGSPCQDLSVAGKREGLQGTRSSLFFHFARILKEKQPSYFVWENVKGALSSNRGHDFTTILNTFSESGYSIWWQILNATWFGVPQNRERVFIVGVRNGSPRQVFFERQDSGEDNGIQGQQANTITARYYGAQATGSYIIKRELNAQEDRGSVKAVNNALGTILIGELGRGGQGNRVYDPEGTSVTLAGEAGGRGAKTGLYAVRNRSQGYGVYDPEGASISIVARGGGLGANTGLYAVRSSENKGKQKFYESDVVGTLSANPQSDMIPVLDISIKQGTKLGYIKAEEGDAINFGFPNSKTRRGRVSKDAMSLSTQNDVGVLTGSRIRRLTPTECERLMDLPDGWTQWGLLNDSSSWEDRVELSDTQRYKMCGNGIVVVCAEAVIKEIILGGSQ